MCDFKDARVGDRVWSIRGGWGTIERIEPEMKAHRNIYVMFDNGNNDYHHVDGKVFNSDINPSLFWDEVKIVPPPKPKRKVIKKICGFIQLVRPEHESRPGCVAWGSALFDTYDRCLKGNAHSRDSIICDPIYICHEYEVEE